MLQHTFGRQNYTAFYKHIQYTVTHNLTIPVNTATRFSLFFKESSGLKLTPLVKIYNCKMAWYISLYKPVIYSKILRNCTRNLGSWIQRDQLDVTCFFISLFNAQHVSDVNTSIFRSLRLICWVISWVVLLWFDVCWCYVLVWLGWCGILMQIEALVLKILRLDVLTSETCWALNNEIIQQVTSSWSLFI